MTVKRARVEPETALRRVGPRRLVVGIDVGTRNLGVAVYNPVTKEMRLMLMDLLVARNPITKQYGVLKLEASFAKRNLPTKTNQFLGEKLGGDGQERRRRAGRVVQRRLSRRH